MSLVPAKEATCTESGNIAYYICSGCNRLFEDKDGITETEIEKVTVKAEGHTYSEPVKENEVPVTCTEDGSYDTVVYCTVCHEELHRETITVNKPGHKYAESEWIWDNETAKAKFVCEICKEELTLDATVTKTEDKGVVTYTATVTLNNDTYTDEKTEYIEYTVKFVDYDDAIISEKTYHYREMPEIPDNPTREEDDEYTYTFKGWDKEVTEVTEDATYTAQYDSKAKTPDWLPGDVNGDGFVNNKDVVALFKYVSGENPDVNETALDVNGDGSVNNKDVVLLFKYVSGGDVTISDKPYNPNAKTLMIAVIPKKTKVK